VTLRGVTGSSNLNIEEIKTNIQKIQQYSDAPTMAGFGIKSVEDASTLAACSDGIVIGSSIVQMIADESKTKEFGRIGEYLREMKTAIS
jgi:tryptophan synthase alpha chain